MWTHTILFDKSEKRSVEMSALTKIRIKKGVIRHKDKTYTPYTDLPLHLSALNTFTLWQKIIGTVIVCLFLVGVIVDTIPTLQILIALLSLIYFSDMLFSTWVNSKSLRSTQDIVIDGREVKRISNTTLPVYSILCPLYKESAVLPQFVESIEKLDWPKNKLDVLLLLEEDDQETRAVVKTMKLPRYFRVVIVPDGQPKTKPKACNYGLSKIKGEFVVIYDAEDKPDADQLKKAYCAFRKADKNVVCLQAKLNYYNHSQNLITRLFTAEYSLWFDITLPGLQSLKTAIPLGGTSNHFRADVLKKLKGWDPFNVTEDADLGVRLFKSGYKTAIIDSVTFEEANSHIRNWIRQRSRWIKGYMQTYLVHTRDFFTFFRRKPLHALYFQMTIGGKIAFILINPVLWVVTILYFALRASLGSYIETLYPNSVLYLAVTSLVFGNFIFMYFYMIGCAKREQWSHIKYVLLIPLYWVLLSIGGFLAAYQLLFKPHYWEKTVHGFHLGQKPSGFKTPSISIPRPVVSLPSVNIALPSVPKLHVMVPRLRIAVNQKLLLNGLFFGFFSFGYSGSDLYFLNTHHAFDFGTVSLIVLLVYLLFLPLQLLIRSKTIQNTIYSLSIMAFSLSLTQVILVSLRVDAVPIQFLFAVVAISVLFITFLYFSEFRKSAILDANLESIAGIFEQTDTEVGKNLNILIFNWRDTKHIWAGGAEKYIHELAKRWVKDGNSVTLFCSNDNHNAKNETIDGITIYRRGGHYSVYGMAILYYLFKFRGKFDVIVDCENGIPFFTPLFTLKPVFLLIHHVHQEVFRSQLLFPFSQIAAFLEGTVMPIVYKNYPVVTVSESSKRDIVKLGFQKNQISTVYNGISKDYLTPIKKTSYPSLCYVGRLKSYKSIDTAIHAFAHILSKYPNARFTIAGFGESSRKLKKLARALKVEHAISFKGWVSEKEKARIFGKSWFAVQPSIIEGWGITVIESNACGTPVIASNVNGLKDSVINGKTGVLVRAQDASDMAASMVRLIENKELREYLTQQAYSWAQHFDWETSAHDFYDLLEKLTAGKVPKLAFARNTSTRV